MKNQILTITMLFVLIACEKRSATEAVQSSDSSNVVSSSGVASNDLQTSEHGEDVIINEINLTELQNQTGEYTSFLISFSMETTEGPKMGHLKLSTNYYQLDSLFNPEYLKRALMDRGRATDSLAYWKHKLSYYYNVCYDSKLEEARTFQYYLADHEIIPISMVSNIKIDNIEISDNTEGFGSKLTVQDTTWANERPLRCVSINGYLCSYRIFIYKESKHLTAVLKQMEKHLSVVKEIEAKSVGDDYNPQEDMAKYEDEIDDKLRDEVNKIQKEKIVILSVCTC